MKINECWFCVVDLTKNNIWQRKYVRKLIGLVFVLVGSVKYHQYLWIPRVKLNLEWFFPFPIIVSGNGNVFSIVVKGRFSKES
jgi:hypothetical protein